MRSANTELELRFNKAETLNKMDEGQIKNYNYDLPHFQMLHFPYDDMLVFEHNFLSEYRFAALVKHG